MTTGDMQHWENIYSTKAKGELSWHQEDALDSLELIGQYAKPGSSVIDVGGGSSTLAAALIRLGFGPCTVVDLSAVALQRAQASLDAETTARITWRVADLLQVPELGHFDVWHDRAVFHFLTEPAQRMQYVELAGRTVRPGGILVLAAFSPDGPERCSGLPACRYGASTLSDIFAANFRRIAASTREHVTPKGLLQSFTFVVMERLPRSERVGSTLRTNEPGISLNRLARGNAFDLYAYNCLARDTAAMHFRWTLASSLIAILLLLSYGAPACETNCDLAITGPSCHDLSLPHATQSSMSDQMPGMLHQGMSGSGKPAAAREGCVSTAQACAHQVCAQQPALLNDGNVSLLHVAVPPVAVIVAAYLMTRNTQGHWGGAQEPANLRMFSPVSHRTTLRL